MINKSILEKHAALPESRAECLQRPVEASRLRLERFCTDLAGLESSTLGPLQGKLPFAEELLFACRRRTKSDTYIVSSMPVSFCIKRPMALPGDIDEHSL